MDRLRSEFVRIYIRFTGRMEVMDGDWGGIGNLTNFRPAKGVEY